MVVSESSFGACVCHRRPVHRHQRSCWSDLVESLNHWSKCTRRPWACHRAVLNLTTLAAAGRNCFRTRSRVTRVIFEGGMSDLNLIVTITTENGGARDIDAVLVLASSSWRKNLNWSWRSWIRFFGSCQPFPKVFLFFAHVVGAQGREDQISSEARGRADKFWHNCFSNVFSCVYSSLFAEIFFSSVRFREVLLCE